MTTESSRLQSVHELEELISLGEKLSEKLLQIRHQRARTYAQLISSTLIFYMIAILTAVAGESSRLFYVFSEYAKLAQFISLGMGIAALLAITYYLVSKFTVSKELKKALLVETEILDRLVAMIHDQRARVENQGISMVSQAIYEMRIKRLHAGV